MQGLYAKQGCGYYQSKTARTNISGNVIFGGPRAGIELTDAMVGGHTIANNLLVDLTRETTDHGPINTWGRVPFVRPFTTKRGPFWVPNGSVTMRPVASYIYQNFMCANFICTLPPSPPLPAFLR